MRLGGEEWKERKEKKFEKGKGNVQEELRGSEWLTQLARALHHSIAQSATAHHSDVNGREVCGDRPYRPPSSPFKSPKYFPILAKRQHLARCMDIYMRRVHVKAIRFFFCHSYTISKMFYKGNSNEAFPAADNIRPKSFKHRRTLYFRTSVGLPICTSSTILYNFPFSQ